MEAVPLNQEGQLSVAYNSSKPKKTNHFIEGNAVEGDLWNLKHRHLVPTYADSTPLISHSDFIEVVQSVVEEHYNQEGLFRKFFKVKICHLPICQW